MTQQATRQKSWQRPALVYIGACAAEGESAATPEKPVSCGTTSCAQGPTLGLKGAPHEPRFSSVSLRFLLPRSLLAAMLLLSGCGESKDSAADRAVSNAAKPSATTTGPTAEHLGLTPAYLEGDWCNTHIQFPDTRSPENRHYRFAADGSFAAQTDPTSEMKPGLVYRYRPNGKIGVDGLLYQVKSVQPDDFVLHIAVNDLHFHRGACQ